MVLTGYEARCTLIPMFERFTTRARRVVVQAQEESRKLQHNYIGTEHLLLGLLSESDGLAARALNGAGISLEGTRQEVKDLVGVGKKAPSGHIPFTPRAKKTLELSLREALQLHHEYIGTEHLLLGLIREAERGDKGEGVGVKILQEHAELPAIRAAVLNLLPAAGPETPNARRWRRFIEAARPARPAEPGSSWEPGSEPGTEQAVLSATPAADATLSEAARLAGSQPVGSHHLLLASLADPSTAAARTLVALGLDLDRARDALLVTDVTGTSDELPEEAGRRQLVIRVTEDQLTLEATDPVLVKAGREALAALGGQPPGTIRGDLPVGASLSRAWQALLESLRDIQRRATPPAEPSAEPSGGPSAEPSGGPAAGPAGGSAAGPAAADA
jgi:ATP-dependent Clp protease ATP-binding subunit ClpC